MYSLSLISCFVLLGKFFKPPTVSLQRSGRLVGQILTNVCRKRSSWRRVMMKHLFSNKSEYLTFSVDTVGGEKTPPKRTLFKKHIRKLRIVSLLRLNNFGFYITGFGFFPGVLEGLGRSGRLIGSISTYPGTYKCPWSRVMAKKTGGELSLPCTV